jgi:copper chaperone CopZ
MKKATLTLLAVLFSLGIFAGDTLNLTLKAEKDALGAGKTREALLKIKGVSEATVDTAAGTAEIVYDASKADAKEIIKAFKSSGYAAEVVEHKEFEEWGDDSIDGFHSVLHGMHKAIDAGKMDPLKAAMPKLSKARDLLVKTMTQDASDATTPAEKKSYEEKAAIVETLSKQVDELKEALEGGDKAAVEEAFGKMHKSFYNLLKKLEAEEDMEDAPPPKPKEAAKPEQKKVEAPAAAPSTEAAPAKDAKAPAAAPAPEKPAPKDQKSPAAEGK